MPSRSPWRVAYLRALEAAASRSTMPAASSSSASPPTRISSSPSPSSAPCANCGRVSSRPAGLRPQPAFVAAETAWRMMTKRDPHGNIVRATIAALAAATGGADAVTVLPFSAALGLPDAFARRIARNTQTILIEESNLHRVADPAAGSGAIEASHRCALCNGLDAVPGDRASGRRWRPRSNKASSSARWPRCAPSARADIARRKDTLIGTSDFPDLAEETVSVLRRRSPRKSARPNAHEPLPRIRLAEPFERLRDRSDAILASTGSAAEDLPRLPRTPGRFQRAGRLRQEPVRSWAASKPCKETAATW